MILDITFNTDIWILLFLPWCEVQNVLYFYIVCLPREIKKFQRYFKMSIWSVRCGCQQGVDNWSNIVLLHLPHFGWKVHFVLQVWRWWLRRAELCKRGENVGMQGRMDWFKQRCCQLKLLECLGAEGDFWRRLVDNHKRFVELS